MSSEQYTSAIGTRRYAAAQTSRNAERVRSRTGADLVRAHGLLALLKEDFQVHNREIMLPGFQAIAVYRYGTWTQTVRVTLLRKLLRILYWSLYLFCRNIYGIEMSDSVRVGRRLALGHQHGIVVHPDAAIGDDCIIRQGVTLGAAGKFRRNEAPSLGNRVDIGVNATIMGRVTIGDDVRVGPNVVVQTNVPAGSTVFAQSARIISGVKRRSD